MRPLLLALAIVTAATAFAELPFIENDYTAAVAEARSRNIPIFVEAWAPL